MRIAFTPVKQVVLPLAIVRLAGLVFGTVWAFLKKDSHCVVIGAANWLCKETQLHKAHFKPPAA